MTPMRVSSDFFEIIVDWEDQTPYGGPLSDRLQDTVRLRLYPDTAEMLRKEMSRPVGERNHFPARDLAEIVLREREKPTHKAIIDDADFWNPDPEQVRQRSAIIQLPSSGMVLEVPLTADGISSLRHALLTGETDNPGLSLLFDETNRAVTKAGFTRARLSVDLFPATPVFVGHACVTWTDGDLRLWADPFLPPKNLRYPLHYQPIGPCDVT